MNNGYKGYTWWINTIIFFNKNKARDFSLNTQKQEFYPSSIKCWSGYAHLHIMPFITKKFQEILLSGLRGVVLTNCFSSIFHFGQISKFKKGVIPEKNESKSPLNIYMVCPSQLQSFMKFFERLQRSCADKLFQ